MNHYVVLVPGLGNSGESHWQSYWECELENCVRVQQHDWDNPQFDDWMAALEATVASIPAPVILVGHSLACALIAHWAGSSRHVTKVLGALLVAPADVDSATHTPAVVRSFAPMPLLPLPFRTRVIASEDDPYVDVARARRFAADWGAHFVSAGHAGHINAASHLGSWAWGKQQLRALLG